MSDNEEKASSSNEEASDDSLSDNERDQIREELKEMSFEDLIKLKQKLGTKVYNSTVMGQSSKKKTTGNAEFKRENKNRPREMSFKKPVQIRKKRSNLNVMDGPRDPRFDSNCGEFDRNEFRERFSFVNELKEKEIVELKGSLKTTTDPEERNKIKLLMQRLNNQAREEKKRATKEKVNLEEKEQIKQLRQEGKVPIFASKKKRKLQELVDQFKQLKETGGLQKHLEKRRKKNRARDVKKLKLNE